MIPTVETFMAKLASNKSEAIAFDNARPDLTRLQHCQLVLSKVQNSCGHIADSKRLRDARATNAQLKNEVAIAKNRLKFLTPEAVVRHNLHAAPGCKKAVGPAKLSKATPAPVEPQRELTGFARTAAAFAATAPKAPTKPAPTSTLTGFAKVSAAFAAQALK